MVILRFFRMLYYWQRIYRILRPNWIQYTGGCGLMLYSWYYAKPWMGKVDETWVAQRRSWKKGK